MTAFVVRDIGSIDPSVVVTGVTMAPNFVRKEGIKLPQLNGN